MATKRIPIIGFATMADQTGESWLEAFQVLATNDAWQHNVINFGADNTAQPTVRCGFFGLFTVPKDYVGTAKLIIVWSTSKTSGNVVWDLDFRTVGGDDTTSLDQAGTERALTVTDAAPGAAWRRLETSITLTDGDFSVDETVEFGFFRDGVDAADTMAGTASLFGLFFEYNDV